MKKIRFCIHCNIQIFGKKSKTCGSKECIKLNKRIHSKKRVRTDYSRKYNIKRKLESEGYRISCSERNKNYYKNNKEKKTEQYKQWNIKNKEKIRDKILRKKYGIGVKEVNNIIESQNNQCPICLRDLVKPQVDHDHKTGIIRGVLCLKCNVSLGNIEDDIGTLKRMIKYLEKWDVI